MKESNQLVQEWITRADKDFELANHILEEDWNFEYVCYFCEQAVEKYLKAYIVLKTHKLTKKEWTHNLIFLSNVCKSLGLNLDGFHKEFRMLSAFYMPTRYPMLESEKLTQKEAREALKYAEKIIKVIKKNLK
jgi:HEPN domain-containing protein